MAEDLFPPGVSSQEQSSGALVLVISLQMDPEEPSWGLELRPCTSSAFQPAGIQACQQQWGWNMVTALCSELKDEVIPVFLHFSPQLHHKHNLTPLESTE